MTDLFRRSVHPQATQPPSQTTVCTFIDQLREYEVSLRDNSGCKEILIETPQDACNMARLQQSSRLHLYLSHVESKRSSRDKADYAYM